MSEKERTSTMNIIQTKERIEELNQMIKDMAADTKWDITSQKYSDAITKLILIEYYRGEVHGLYLTIRESETDSPL